MSTNKDILNKIIIFTAGAAIGSAVTWKVLRTKYDRITQEEIDSMRDYYEKKYGASKGEPDENVENEEESPVVVTEEDVQEYKDILEKCEYVTESNDDEIQNEKESDREMDRPYVISPEEFAESENEIITLTYYANDVLRDEFGGVMDKDIWEEYVGEDFASHFGEYDYDPDVVYVRNETFGIDYEILKELSNYTEGE